MAARFLAVLFALVAWSTAAWARAADVPAAPTDYVTDAAGAMSAGAREALDARLRAYEKKSGHQIVVWIGRTSGDASIEEFAVRAFEAWKIGRKGLDDGVALFVLVDDRKVRIEVGYGLEDRLTDLQSGRIIREAIVPAIARGDFDTAIVSGVERIADTIEGEAGALPGASTIRGPPPRASERGLGSWLWIVVLGAAFLLLAITHPRLALLLLWSMAGRGGGGFGGFSGGGGGFGGFSGGGGRSGGGGATGGW